MDLEGGFLVWTGNGEGAKGSWALFTQFPWLEHLMSMMTFMIESLDICHAHEKLAAPCLAKPMASGCKWT